MAIVLLGKTKCALCEGAIEKDTPVKAFPSFLSRTHEFAKFSDAAFHEACFEQSTSCEPVNKLYSRYCEIWDSRPPLSTTGVELENFLAKLKEL